MSQADIFPAEIAVLYTPVWYSDTERQAHPLPLGPGDYKVTPGHSAESWTVTSLKDGTTVYSGIGPVEIRRPPAAG
jgi:hypothetical protein